MSLNDTALRAAKPRSAPYKLTDSAGLYLLIRPSGSKLWRLDYAFLGKRNTLALGSYPMIGLAEARRERDKAKELIARNTDPSTQRKLDRIAAQAAASNTFELIAEEWLAHVELEGHAASTMTRNRRCLKLAYPAIGRLPVSEIKAQELLVALRKVEARSHYETTSRMRSLCGRVFRYAIATGRAERDPSRDLDGALITPKVRHRAAIVEPKAIGALLRAIDGYDGHPVTKSALQIAPLVFVRPGELRHGEWREFDLAAAIWKIPAEKMKMKTPHLVPLSRQGLAILTELRESTGNGKYLFPSIRSASRPMSENTINAALRRLGYAQEEITGHGFRSMASTLLNELGQWRADVIERQLAHQERNKVRAAYNHAQYLPERTAMMQAWADYLDSLKQARVNSLRSL